MTEASADLREIVRSVSLLHEDGDVVELRIPNTTKRTVSGYFTDGVALARAAAGWSGTAPGIYTTLNVIDPSLLARAHNRTVTFAKNTTADADIVSRRWLPIDLDAVRPAGVSASSEEHNAALARA